MAVNQIYSLVNEIGKQVVGNKAVAVIDAGTFVSLGDVVLSTDENKDKFYQKLADRIGKVVSKYKEYEIKNKKYLYKTPLEYGMALQKVQTFKIASMRENKSWVNTYNPYSNTVDNTDIVSQIFSERGVFEVEPKVIYDYQLETAFISASQMASFVNMIFQDAYNAMNFALENLANTTIATAIATCIHNVSTAPTCARNLLKEYNDKHTSSTLTVATCLEDLDFLKFMSKEINLVTKRMQTMSELFNSAGADRFTSKDDMVVYILSDVASCTASYLEADTYHNELVKLPNYVEQNYWQGSGTDFSFGSTSSINITVGKDTDAYTVNKSGIIAFVCDKEKCGVMYDRVRTKSMYSPSGERTIYYHKADIGNYVDTTENGVVFYIEDEVSA